MSWLDNKHKDYRKTEPKRQRVRVHYQADIDELRDEQYLVRRAQGESAGQFNERLQTSDYFPLLSVIVDSYDGRLKAAEEQVTRNWSDKAETESLGNPKDQDTIAHRLWHDIDGRGTNYLTMLHDASSLLMNEQEVWCLVDGIPRDEQGVAIGEATVRTISPSAVWDWSEDKRGRLEWAKVYHLEDVRSGPESTAAMEPRWTIYYRDRYEVWRKVEDEDGEVTEDLVGAYLYGGTEEDPFYYYRTAQAAQRGQESMRMAPIFRVRLPQRRYVSHILAHKAEVIFNKESERDNILRVANTPKGVFAGREDEFEETAAKAQAGDNLWLLDPDSRQKHYYMTPDTSAAKIATEVLQKKIETFFLSAFRFYEDAVHGSQKTATEVSQDAAAGEDSFLNTVQTARTELERGIGWLLEQTYMPDNPEAWGQFRVDAPTNFQPVDAEAERERILQRYFGSQTVPLTEEAEVKLTMEQYERDELPVDEDEIRLQVMRKRNRQAQEDALTGEIFGEAA